MYRPPADAALVAATPADRHHMWAARAPRNLLGSSPSIGLSGRPRCCSVLTACTFPAPLISLHALVPLRHAKVSGRAAISQFGGGSPRADDHRRRSFSSCDVASRRHVVPVAVSDHICRPSAHVLVDERVSLGQQRGRGSACSGEIPTRSGVTRGAIRWSLVWPKVISPPLVADHFGSHPVSSCPLRPLAPSRRGPAVARRAGSMSIPHSPHSLLPIRPPPVPATRSTNNPKNPPPLTS